MARKPSGGLTKWFKEDWRDVKTGKKCGRSGKKDKGRPYPACRPKTQSKSAAAKKAANSGASEFTYAGRTYPTKAKKDAAVKMKKKSAMAMKKKSSAKMMKKK